MKRNRRSRVPGLPGAAPVRVDRAPPPDGYLASVNPETGQPDRMAVWLPPGVTASDLGIRLTFEKDAA